MTVLWLNQKFGRPTLIGESRKWGFRGSEGQSLVELALTVPLFLLILVGAVEYAHFAWASIKVANAARAGVQFAAEGRANASNSAGISAAVLNDGVGLSGLTSTSNISCACANGGTTTAVACSTALSTCPSPAIILEYVQVNTSAQINTLFNYPGIPGTFTARGQATMEVEQ